MSPSQIIVLATPVFLALIAIEYVTGLRRRRNTYRLDDAITSIGLGMLSQISAVFTRLLRIGLYTLVYAHVAIGPGEAFWTSWAGWLLALVFYDFCYYWLHRAGHECAVFWAAHVVHHQSQDYNLSTALRQTSSGALLGWIFYLPMAVAGVPPLVFGVVALIDLLYQFWVHTEQVGKLGWFDRWFCSPSNHRVHHAVNDRYLDRNYGGILIVWDRLFGSFREEDERCVYGTRKPLDSWDPLWANAEVYWSLLRDAWHTRRWRDKLRVWFKPPGWRPADVAARFPSAAFDMARVQRFAPPMGRGVRVFAAVQFLALLAGVAGFLWLADTWPLWRSGVVFTVLLAAQWALGAVMQGRIRMGEALLIECAALAMASSALGWTVLHLVFKPLTMLVALAVVVSAWREAPRRLRGIAPWLLAALAASLAGDVFLMLPGHFIAGLAAFLLAHLAYIALFRQGGVGWLPSRQALAWVLALALAMLVVLWQSGLPTGLRAPVAAYVAAISLMAAQALGRAMVLRDTPSRMVAFGALCFMASDALLAVNRFVAPLPVPGFWVLTTYYAAQCLIVAGLLRTRPPEDAVQAQRLGVDSAVA
ncbi:lysoplasmalogenase family protein [Hydrogenophaga sp.]|uniref:lysoplasmalogenase family protein n=1 Tax=Hydrogenophaga sp. TaxID=1904254 RepID=UPI002603D560|nr:lysoplasmalogenase family protein [Hydrogenophaga sp.]MCW5654188.1 sterol desaturase family protein [Hydrogenophaga sp.]